MRDTDQDLMSVLVVKNKSEIKSLADLRGKTIGFGAVEWASGGEPIADEGIWVAIAASISTSGPMRSRTRSRWCITSRSVRSRRGVAGTAGA